MVLFTVKPVFFFRLGHVKRLVLLDWDFAALCGTAGGEGSEGLAMCC